MFLAAIAVVVALICLVIFRNKKRLALGASSMIVAVYIGYYFYYPIQREQTHAAAYNVLTAYLQQTYPDANFDVYTKDYEPGVVVGDFQVNHVETPEYGVTLRVLKDHQIEQTSYWVDTGGYPQQQEIWEDLHTVYNGNYTLDQEITTIELKDQWIQEEKTVFALNVQNKPAIAIYHYEDTGYSLIDIVTNEAQSFVEATWDNLIFVYIDEACTENQITLSNGLIIDAQQKKGMLLKLES